MSSFKLSKEIATGLILTVGEAGSANEAAGLMEDALSTVNFQPLINIPKKRPSKDGTKATAPAATTAAAVAPTLAPTDIGIQSSPMPAGVGAATPPPPPPAGAATPPPPPPPGAPAADSELTKWAEASGQIITNTREAWGAAHTETVDTFIVQAAVAAGIVPLGANQDAVAAAMGAADALAYEAFYGHFSNLINGG